MTAECGGDRPSFPQPAIRLYGEPPFGSMEPLLCALLAACCAASCANETNLPACAAYFPNSLDDVWPAIESLEKKGIRRGAVFCRLSHPIEYAVFFFALHERGSAVITPSMAALPVIQPKMKCADAAEAILSGDAAYKEERLFLVFWAAAILHGCGFGSSFAEGADLARKKLSDGTASAVYRTRNHKGRRDVTDE